MPQVPASRFPQNSSSEVPIAVTAPRPVMTTRRERGIRRFYSPAPGSAFDASERIAPMNEDNAPGQRVDWHTYFMNIAHQAATRSTCPRKHVGAVIVRDKTILSTGYNGSLPGLPHCEEVGCMMEDGHCVATVHAEANAILQAAKNGVMIAGGELYTTASPCWNCFKLIATAGVKRIYYGEFYRDKRSLEIARDAGVELVSLSGPA
jgi:dCMP deaminase